MMINEHGPIRNIWIKFMWPGIKYWVAMHWKTHIWPSRTNTSREDRTGVPRSERRQTDPVNFEGRANPQHLIDTMRKRLCGQADPETRAYAEDLKATIHETEPEIADVLVPNCVYRAGCPEIGKCEKWPAFVSYCVQHAGKHPGTMAIHQRYMWYNDWFYNQRRV
jgi:hypothetical protein